MSSSLADIGLRCGESVLVYGIGNVGRQDDGIGVRLVERLEREAPPADAAGDWTFETHYQLGIEDALLVSRFDVVVFLDASCDPRGAPFTVVPVVPSMQITFTTHAMSFSSVLSIGEELYGRNPRAFLVAIAGEQWGISEELSPYARSNLEEAFFSLSVMRRARRRAGSDWPHEAGLEAAHA
jgi:hydrogenase maturation protease